MNALASVRAAAVGEKIEVKWELMFLSNSAPTTTHPFHLSWAETDVLVFL